MVSRLLEITAPSGWPWVIDQSRSAAVQGAALLLLRVALLCACSSCS